MTEPRQSAMQPDLEYIASRPHPFLPYANAHRYHGCVRCGRKRDDALHRRGSALVEGRAAALHNLAAAQILVRQALDVDIEPGAYTVHMVKALALLGRAAKELEP